jgi:tetratricopeptide (TPR) repeat protein
MIIINPEEKFNIHQLKKNKNLYQNQLRDNPENINVRELLARTYYFLREIENAYIECEKCLSLSPKNPNLLWLMGCILSIKSKYTEGENYFRESINIIPESAIVNIDLGVNLLLQGKLEEAKLFLEIGSEIAPEYWRSHFNLSSYFKGSISTKKHIKKRK